MMECAIATIGMDGNIISTIVKMDGFLNGVGLILNNCYLNYKDVYSLIIKGEIKRLDIDIPKSEFGDKDIHIFKDISDFYDYFDKKAFQYLYFYDMKKWWFVDFSLTKGFMVLDNDAFITERKIFNNLV
jgi:hypothetical protein